MKGHEDQAGYQQNGQQVVVPQNRAEEPASNDDRGRVPAVDINEKKAPKGSLTGGSGDWLGGPQNGEEATYQQNGQQVVVPTGTGDQAKEAAGTKDWLGGPQNGAEAPGSKESGPTGSGKSQGEGARNPQTGERYARNPQTGE